MTTTFSADELIAAEALVRDEPSPTLALLGLEAATDPSDARIVSGLERLRDRGLLTPEGAEPALQKIFDAFRSTTTATALTIYREDRPHAALVLSGGVRTYVFEPIREGVVMSDLDASIELADVVEQTLARIESPWVAWVQPLSDARRSASFSESSSALHRMGEPVERGSIDDRRQFLERLLAA